MSRKNVYLVRHGTPDWTRKDLRYDIPPGPPLIPQGREEARLTGRYLAARGVEVLYASPMDRAAQTAEIIADVLELPICPAPGLTEWVQGESRDELRERLLEFWQEVIEGGRENAVALVSHGAPIEVLIQHFVPSAHLDRRFDNRNCVPPAGVWHLWRESPDHPWRSELVFMPEVARQAV